MAHDEVGRGEKEAQMDGLPATGVDTTEDDLHASPTTAGSERGAPSDGDDSVETSVPDGARLAAEAVRLCGGDEGLAALVERYWRYAPDEELVDLDPPDMLAAAKAHRELAEQRLPGELKLSISPSTDGDTTVVGIVTDDMPFLVDTVAG